MPSQDRRSFLTDVLRTGVALAGAAALPQPLLAGAVITSGEGRGPADPDPKALAWRAVEAARASGATYADVRLTHGRERGFTPSTVENAEQLRAGVRALVDGHWGFASSPHWTPDEMARLSAEAVAQARTNRLAGSRMTDLGTIPVVRDGHWVTPIKADPFTVPLEEVLDFLNGLRRLVGATAPGASLGSDLRITFTRQEKVFASTEGSSFTQIVYAALPVIAFRYERMDRGVLRSGERGFEFLTPAGRGWEHLKQNERRIWDAVPRFIDEIEEDWRLPEKAVEVGRYDVVFDAHSMSTLVAETLGCATQLDRALGYEANAGGSSYLNAPLEMLGSYRAGAPLLSVTGNRSQPGGLATVQWDDDGAASDDWTLVRDGVLVDFQTSRESANWLAPWYAKRGIPVRTHGCVSGPSAGEAPLIHTPNLAVLPGREDLSFDELCAGAAKGLAFLGAKPSMDFQCLNGLSGGTVYEIRNGRRVARVHGAGLLFRSPELWRGLAALGGPKSVRWLGVGASSKGEPPQSMRFSVGAVPGMVRQATIIDLLRKA